MTLTVAVDGSALGNPGPAGWAWVISADEWDSGGWDHGTNNLGELTAVQQILLATEAAGLQDEPLHLLADSQYAINVITKWMHGWKKRSWTKADKKPIANLELIQDIDRLIAGRPVTFEWVRGHAGHHLNELADDRAREAATLHQSGKVAPGGPGLSRPGSDSLPHQGEAPLLAHQGTVTVAPLDSLAPSGRSLHTPEAYPATTAPTGELIETPETSTTTSNANVCAASPVEPESCSSNLTEQVERAQQDLVAAWLNGRQRIVDSYIGVGFERVWPDGTLSDSYAGPCPSNASVTNLRVRTLTGGCLVTYELTWTGGRSREASLWENTPDGPRIIHHQSTMAQR